MKTDGNGSGANVCVFVQQRHIHGFHGFCVCLAMHATGRMDGGWPSIKGLFGITCVSHRTGYRSLCPVVLLASFCFASNTH